MRVTVFGLGEAGSLIAADLVGAGVDVRGFDPAPVRTPYGVVRHDDPAPAVSGSSLVIAATAAIDCMGALAQAADRMSRGTVYADMATAAPGLKRDLGEAAGLHGLSFVDVALMSTVPGKGLATPALAAGPGAVRLADALNDLGARIEVISDRPGDAAARKLLRSIVTKGLASLLIESLEAAEARGDTAWMWQHLVDLLTGADEHFMHRLVDGTPQHADRRIVEMESAVAFLESLDVSPTMTAATVGALRRVRDEGLRDTIIPFPRA